MRRSFRDDEVIALDIFEGAVVGLDGAAAAVDEVENVTVRVSQEVI